MGVKTIAILLKDLKAYKNYVRPIIMNSPRHYQYVIFHLNTLYTEVQIPEDSNVVFIDLRRNLDLREEISCHNIELLISINPGNIFDIFVISMHKQMGILTAYYQHGLQLDFTSFDPKILAQNKSLKRKKKSIVKYIFFSKFFIRNIRYEINRKYLIFSVLTKGLQLLRSSGIQRYPKYGLVNNHVDYAFVFGAKDKEYLISSMGMMSDAIFITGYPFEPSAAESDSVETPGDVRKTVLYLSAALRTVGVTPISFEEEIQFYQLVAQNIELAGYHLVLKLHPLENKKEYEFALKDSNITIESDASIVDLAKKASVVMGEYSTALFYAIREFKPIIILNSPYFEEYPFDYTKYGIGIRANIDEITDTISKIISTEVPAIEYENFLQSYASFNKNETSYERLFRNLDDLLK